jgi:SWI/SNF-related matrix-associated actin-dependent regulator of chromatin subfamily B member 1
MGNCQPNLLLIPIKLEIEMQGRRLKDMFLWDKNEPYLTLEEFAKILMEEHNLPEVFEAEIISSMRRQIHAFKHYKQMESELVRVIQINIRIGNIVLRDKFEWDINNP